MNKRILKLFNEAGFHQPEMERLGIEDKFEKFAELMVKKFDDILVLEYLDCVGNKDKQAAERIQRLQEKVKTYFGVEE